MLGHGVTRSALAFEAEGSGAVPDALTKLCTHYHEGSIPSSLAIFMRTNSKLLVQKRQWIQEFIREIKNNTPCTDCHRKYPYYVMQFDHTGHSAKTANISDLVRKTVDFSRIWKELAKTEVVCANCHHIRTYKRAKHKASL